VTPLAMKRGVHRVHRARVSRASSESDAVGIRIGGVPEPPCTVMRTWRPIVAARIAAQRLQASTGRSSAEILCPQRDATAQRSVAVRGADRGFHASADPV
jgi:hypothetical protein